jgi:molecular chaperone HscB
MALGRAIEVNEAFRVVKDPIRRAEALVKRAGLELSETNEPKPSPALLMDMMDQREELSDARKKGDLAGIARLGAAMRKREEAALAKLGEKLDAGRENAEAMRAALPLLGELRYIRRFLDEVSALEEELAS